VAAVAFFSRVSSGSSPTGLLSDSESLKDRLLSPVDTAGCYANDQRVMINAFARCVGRDIEIRGASHARYILTLRE
jgi:hypothetical protein